jgi:hypothetical protein
MSYWYKRNAFDVVPSHALSTPSSKCFQTQVIVAAAFRKKFAIAECDRQHGRGVRSPDVYAERAYSLFSMGAPTLLPHSVQDPS